MRTRTKHLVALMPPQRFREEKAAEKSENLFLKASKGPNDLFRRPKGRPLKVKNDRSIPNQIDKKRTRPGVHMSHEELRHEEKLQFGGVL